MARILSGDAYVCTIGGEEIPIRNVRFEGPDMCDLHEDFSLAPVHWEGTVNFTTTQRRPQRAWEESPQRAMARVLNAPELLPQGPEREAELRRARRRARNRSAAAKGGMVPHGWPLSAMPELPWWITGEIPPILPYPA